MIFKKTDLCLETLSNIKKAADEKNIKFWLLGGLAIAFYTGRVYRDHGDLDLIVKSPIEQKEFLKILESLEFKKIREKKLTKNLTNFVYENKQGIEIDIGPHIREFGITDEDFEEPEKELNNVKCHVLSKRYLINSKKYLIGKRNEEKDLLDLKMLENLE